MKLFESLEKQAKAKLERVGKCRSWRRTRPASSETSAECSHRLREKRKDEERRLPPSRGWIKIVLYVLRGSKELEAQGRENVERKNRMREELQKEKGKKKKRTGGRARAPEAKTMAREEHLMWLHLEYIPELPEQVMMRRYGTLESTVLAGRELMGMARRSCANRRAPSQNLHMLEIFLIQPERNDDVAEWGNTPTIKTLNLDLTQFPNAVDIKAKSWCSGARLL